MSAFGLTPSPLCEDVLYVWSPRYLEKNLGCNPMVLGSQFSKSAPCTTKEQLLALANASRKFQDADDDDIYELTGCLPSCKRDQFSLTVDPMNFEIATKYKCQVQIDFIMLDSSYKEEEQYIIYDVDSFFADIGGFMGLLLGSSILSLYMTLEEFMRKLIYTPFRGKISVRQEEKMKY